MSIHNGAAFSTMDRDNDAWDEGSCAQVYGGGWWYADCVNVSLFVFNFYSN